MDKQFTSEMWDKAWDKGFKITENIKYNEACLKSYPDIKKTVWNNPATIVILKTGEKGVAKVQPGDIWNAELGFWVAYAKALQKKTQPIHLHLLESAAGTAEMEKKELLR